MNSKALIGQAYAAFNERDAEGVLALMSDDVSWPKAAEGGRIVGKQEVRDYWTRQWVVFNVRVEPQEIVNLGNDKFEVRVRQLVKNVEGDLLFDGEVGHIYTIKDGQIKSMALKGEDSGSSSSPTAAFAKR